MFDLFAQETVPFIEEMTAELPPINYAWELAKMVGALICVIALIVGSAYMIKRLSRNRMQLFNSNAHIKIVERRALSQKSVLYLVEVKGKTVLLGDSPGGGVSILTEVPPSFPEIVEQKRAAK